MADGIKFDTSQIDALNERLNIAAKKMGQLRGSKQAARLIRSALAPVVKNAQARVKTFTAPHLRDAIKAYVLDREDSELLAEVGVKYAGRKHFGRHAHLVEGGHGGPHPAEAHPFWQPAIDATYKDMVENTEEAVEKVIDEILDNA